MSAAGYCQPRIALGSRTESCQPSHKRQLGRQERINGLNEPQVGQVETDEGRWIKLADQARQGDLAFLVISVIAAAQIEPRTRAILDHGSWNSDPAINRSIT